MESFGRILKSVREEKQIDIEQIAGETSISKEYLIALEEENLEVIPGSTYTVGFLRNYSDYLGCDTKYLLDLYVNYIYINPHIILSRDKKLRLRD